MTPELILVIEDDAQVLATTVRILGKLGYAVLAASDLKQGREHLEAHQDSINLVVSDTNLPDGDSYELHLACEDLIQRHQIGWLGLTGNPVLNPEAIAYYNARGIEMVIKPFGVGELMAAVKRAIKKKTQTL